MSIITHPDWGLSEKGKKDSERHQEKIDDAIRKNVKDAIAEESIITNKGKKKVRIPVKGLKDYRFKHGKREGEEEGKEKGKGIGQGQGKPGDVVGRKEKDGQDPDKPGNEPGEDFIEVEVDIDYLIEVMFEDLGLPYIEEKTKKQQLVQDGYKFEAISKKGIMSRLHKKRTMMEAIKRNESYVGEIVNQTKCNMNTGRRALVQSKGDIIKAIDIINNDDVDQSIDPHVFIEDDDLRYRQIEDDYTLHSNAVVIAAMDTSGSMTKYKKYLCRSLLFWMVQFLRTIYDSVEIEFITHTTEAKRVDEETFFHKGESGGTYCWSAFEKASEIIDIEYPISEWNVYCIYVSDGDDWDPNKTIESIKKLLSRNINMLSYNEVKPQDDLFETMWGSSNSLIKSIKETWNFDCDTTSSEGVELCRNNDLHFVLSTIKNKTHVYPTLKYILFKENKNAK